MAQDYRPAFGGEGLTMSTYVSPRRLTTKSVEELRQLREKKRRLLYFGLEPGGCVTLAATRTLLPNSSYPQRGRQCFSAAMVSTTSIVGSLIVEQGAIVLGGIEVR